MGQLAVGSFSSPLHPLFDRPRYLYHLRRRLVFVVVLVIAVVLICLLFLVGPRAPRARRRRTESRRRYEEIGLARWEDEAGVITDEGRNEGGVGTGEEG